MSDVKSLIVLAEKSDGAEAAALYTKAAELILVQAMKLVNHKSRGAGRRLVPGATLKHIRRGEELARCVYQGPGRFVFNRKIYPSISAAANAAAKHLGLKSTTLNGWWFWGVEKRVQIREKAPKKKPAPVVELAPSSDFAY